MSIHLDIELADATVVVDRVEDYQLDLATDMPSIEFGVPGPSGPPGPPGPAGASTATQVSFAPVGDLAATNVQAALTEVDAEKPPYAYVDSHGVYVSPTPPADPTQWALWVDSS